VAILHEIASFHSQQRIVQPVPSKAKESSLLLAMTERNRFPKGFGERDKLKQGSLTIYKNSGFLS